MKILVIAPNYRPASGPSNSLYFLRYIKGSKLLFYANSISSKDEDGIRVLRFPNMNHYVTSRVVKRIVDRFRPDYIISISPELMIHLKEKELERSVVIPQGVLEPVIFKFEPLVIRASFIYPEISYISRGMTYAAISMYMYRRVNEIFRPKKVGLIYNPVRELFFKLGDERVQRGLVDCDRCKRRLLYVGVLKRLKGVDKLIRFFPSVLREFRDAELHIVGDGPLRGYLTYLVHKLGLEGKVFIHGYMTDFDLLKMYSITTLLVTASYWESFCLPVGEAAASAIPSVVREVYALKEHVEWGYAVGFKEDSGESFVRAIGKALDDYKKLALRGHEISKKLFYPMVVAKRVSKLLVKL
jgi:glycosyltransferase involved in cell wall biosynthesis